MKIVNYDIVVADNTGLLQTLVTQKIGAGWQPFGNLLSIQKPANPNSAPVGTFTIVYLQTIVKYQ